MNKAWFLQNSDLVFGVLFAVSELLGSSHKIKSNGIFQLAYNILNTFAGLFMSRSAPRQTKEELPPSP